MVGGGPHGALRSIQGVVFDIDDTVTRGGVLEASARAMVSSVHAHAVPGNWTKATGVAQVFRNVLGLDADEARRTWSFVGDSGNDEAAFEWFECSVGVANVREHRNALTSLPLYVKEADRGLGFAEVAARLVR